MVENDWNKFQKPMSPSQDAVYVNPDEIDLDAGLKVWKF